MSARCARTSVGEITLKSADPSQHPAIQPNYLATERDRWELRQCVKLTREIFAQKAFDAFRGPELLPGPDVKTDAEIDAYDARQDRQRLPSLRHLPHGHGRPRRGRSGLQGHGG